MKSTSVKRGKGQAANAAKTKAKNRINTPFGSSRKLRAAQVAAPGSRAAVAAVQRKREQEARQKAPIEVTPIDRRTRLLQLLRDNKGNATDTQCRRVLLALESGPCTSLELRRYLDVIQVSTRVHELRKRGFEIETMWVQQATDAGKLHRVGLYVLRVRAG